MSIVKQQPIARLRIVDPPAYSSNRGMNGDVSFDREFLYIYSNRKWKRTALSHVLPADLARSLPASNPDGFSSYVASRWHLFKSMEWRTFMTTPFSRGKHIIKQSSRDMKVHDHILNFRLVPPPTDKYSFGQDGFVSYDQNYFYIFIQNQWFKRAIAIF